MGGVKIRRSDLPADFFNMIPRDAVEGVFFPPGIPQNSIWDFFRTSDNRYFVSLCGEGHVSTTAVLYEFHPFRRTLTPLFDLRRVCMVGPRATPPSKIHTSMDELPDGRLIMLTHTTAPAPGHPCWMLDAYYHHPWEGFAGSHLLIFDPKTGTVSNLGIPVPRETLYGGIYDSSHHAYYMIGFIRGHLYRYDLETGRLDDLGQAAEWGAFRLSRGPDRHLYGSTRSGWLFKVDVDRVRVEDLNYQLSGAPGLLSRRQFAFASAGPDNRLYVAHHCSDRLVALDTGTGRVEDVGSMDPGPRTEKNGPRCMAGMCWDAQGRLWYGLASHVGGGPGFWTHLACWDVTRGQAPRVLGLMGTAERATYYVSEMIHADGRLLAADTNHGMDPPGILMIDLQRLDRADGVALELCRDPFAYAYLEDRSSVAPFAGADEAMRPYVTLLEKEAEGGRFMAQNPFTIRADHVEVIRLWRQVGPDASAVRSLAWEDEHTLTGICGTTPFHQFMISIRTGDTAWSRCDLDPGSPAVFPPGCEALVLPFRPGRQYLAVPSCWGAWNGGRWLVGTRDGLLAILDPVKRTVFNLGPVCPQGPVRTLCTDAERQFAYGTAGDEADPGICFYLDDRIGVRDMGRAFVADDAPCGTANSSVLSAIALSPSGRTLAIGAADRLGTVYIYHDPEVPQSLSRGI